MTILWDVLTKTPGSAWRDLRLFSRCYSPVRDVHSVVIPVPVDKLVIGINPGTRGLLLDHELEALTRSSNPFLAHSKRLFLVLLAAKDSYVDQIVERRRRLDPIAIGIDLPALNRECDLICPIWHLLRGRLDSLVVIE